MSRKMMWSTLVFVVFAFATLMVFFWVRDGSLERAGASMDQTLSKAGSEISGATKSVVGATDQAIDDATDGDDRT